MSEAGCVAVDAAIQGGWWGDPQTPRTGSGRLERGLHIRVVENPSKDKPMTVAIDFFAEGN